MPSRLRNRPSRGFFLLWIMSLFVAGTFATTFGSRTARAEGEPPPEAAQCPATDTGGPELPFGDQTITGTVTDGTDPLADIEVRIGLAGRGQYVTSTNASGEFVIESLGSGTYYVSFFDQSAQYVSGFYDAGPTALSPDLATAVELTGDGATGIDATLGLESVHSITGSVTDYLTQNVPGAELRADGAYFSIAGCATSGPLGEFTIPDLRVGIYRVRATASGYPFGFYESTTGFSATAAGATGVPVVADVTDVNIIFPETYPLSGVVLDGEGNPVGDLSVSACLVGGGGCQGATSASDTGEFEIDTLVSGSYTVYEQDDTGNGAYLSGYYGGDGVFEPSIDDAVTIGVPGSGPIQLLAVEAPQIRGTITNEVPEGVGGLSVYACDLDQINCYYGETVDGSYAIGIAIPGTYTLTVTDGSGTYPSGGSITNTGTIDPDPGAARQVVVSDTTVPGVDAVIPFGGEIAVYVTVAGVPFESAYVQPCHDEFWCSDAFNTGADGQATYGPLWVGTYFVQAAGNDASYWFDEDGPESLNFANASAVVVTAQTTTSVLPIELPGAGTPTDPAGEGVPVTVEPDDGSGNTPVSVKFPEVTGSGTTSLTTSDTGDPVPSGFQVGLPAFYFDLSTTAGYTAPILVCVTYEEPAYSSEANLRLFHFDGGWQDITTDDPALDTVNNVICGRTNSLSPFVLAERTYSFTGIHGPKAPPTFNAVKAGATIGLTFGLGGDFGLSIFAEGWPEVRQISCTTGEPIGGVDATTTSLKYSAKKDTYTLQISTAKAWKNTCRSISFELNDGTFASVWYKLKA